MPRGAGHLADRFHRRNLAGDVDLMRHLNQPRARRYRAFEGCGDLVDVVRRNGNPDQAQLNAFTPLALANRGEHPRIILRRRQHFVAGLQV